MLSSSGVSSGRNVLARPRDRLLPRAVDREEHAVARPEQSRGRARIVVDVEPLGVDADGLVQEHRQAAIGHVLGDEARAFCRIGDPGLQELIEDAGHEGTLGQAREQLRIARQAARGANGPDRQRPSVLEEEVVRLAEEAVLPRGVERGAIGWPPAHSRAVDRATSVEQRELVVLVACRSEQLELRIRPPHGPRACEEQQLLVGLVLEAVLGTIDVGAPAERQRLPVDRREQAVDVLVVGRFRRVVQGRPGVVVADRPADVAADVALQVGADLVGLVRVAVVGGVGEPRRARAEWRVEGLRDIGRGVDEEVVLDHLELAPKIDARVELVVGVARACVQDHRDSDRPLQEGPRTPVVDGEAGRDGENRIRLTRRLGGQADIVRECHVRRDRWREAPGTLGGCIDGAREQHCRDQSAGNASPATAANAIPLSAPNRPSSSHTPRCRSGSPC